MPSPQQIHQFNQPKRPPQVTDVPSLLIVDDDPIIVDTLSYLLGGSFQLITAASRGEAMERLRARGQPLDLALIDLGLPPQPHRPDEGFNLLGELLALDPHCKIVVLSGQNEELHGRHARALGALEFVAKPADPQRLQSTLQEAARLGRSEREHYDGGRPADQIIGRSAAMHRLRELVLRYAPAPFPVLIEGESGSGKELVAMALHRGSGRDGPLVAFNCAAIAPGLIEATLFGHARGAYTGATVARGGYFEEADGGTLFLDEIGELPLELQPKLLRVLENGEFQRVGETQRRVSHARIVAATNRDLRTEVQAGRFRADLYHRLSVLSLVVPPLRALGDDRFLLLAHYLQRYCTQTGAPPFSLDAAASARWADYEFPGNVRELRNIVVRLLTRHAGQNVGLAELEAELDGSMRPVAPTTPALDTHAPERGDVHTRLARAGTIDLDAALRRFEAEHIAAALQLSRGNMAQAARMLGLNRSTLYSRMEALARRGEHLPPLDGGTAQ